MFNRNAFRAKVVGAGMTLSGLASEIGILSGPVKIYAQNYLQAPAE